MNELKTGITAFIAKIGGKGYGWLSRLLNQTDHTLTKVMEYVREKKLLLDQYVMDRKVLLNSIEQAKQEADFF